MELAKLAASLKAQYNLPYADGFAAARSPWYDLPRMSLEFEWDLKKAKANHAHHGIDLKKR
jgi:hypothetical protein